MGYQPKLWPAAGSEFLDHQAEANRLGKLGRQTYGGVYRRIQARYPTATVSQILTVEGIVEFLSTDDAGNPRKPGEVG